MGKDDFRSDKDFDTDNTKPYVGQEGAVGMKYDNGKLLAAIPFQDFPRALKAVAGISTYGAKKYARSSWKGVPGARERYEDALHRHFLEYHISGKYSVDDESGLLHFAHLAWNVLALLELDLEELEKEGGGYTYT